MKKLSVAATLLATALSFPASATVVSGAVTGGTVLALEGRFIKLTVPLSNPSGPANSVGKDNFQSNDLFAFNEDQNIILAAPLVLDVGLGSIAAGTIVASHYVFFDPAQSQRVIGTVNFDSDILGVITSTGHLSASDFLANTGVNYLSPAARGLEPGDSVTISGPRQILFDTVADSPGDYIRVITRFSPTGGGGGAVPEPGSVAVLGVGLLGLAAAWRLRNRRA